MEVVIFVSTVAAVTVICGFCGLVICLNFGIFPAPDEDQFARKLYWRAHSKKKPGHATITSAETCAVANGFVFSADVLVITSADQDHLKPKEIWLQQKIPNFPSTATAGTNGRLLAA